MPHKDPVAFAIYQREYKRANRWRFRLRQKAYDAAKHANERASRFGVSGTITPEEVEAVLATDICYHCWAIDMPLDLDHLVPMAQGGPNELTNLVASCGACNKSKMNAPTPWRWSRSHDRCVTCGRTDRPHICHGQCRVCQRRDRAARDRARKKAVAG